MPNKHVKVSGSIHYEAGSQYKQTYILKDLQVKKHQKFQRIAASGVNLEWCISKLPKVFKRLKYLCSNRCYKQISCCSLCLLLLVLSVSAYDLRFLYVFSAAGLLLWLLGFLTSLWLLAWLPTCSAFFVLALLLYSFFFLLPLVFFYSEFNRRCQPTIVLFIFLTSVQQLFLIDIIHFNNNLTYFIH